MTSSRGRGAAWTPPASSSTGFTLLELLIVMGLISVLMGVGVGFVQRGQTDIDVALLTARDQIRTASTTAKDRGLPTEVEIEPAQDGAPARIVVRGLRTVGHWHLESDERWIDSRLRPALNGTVEPGRFGEARRPDLDAPGAMLALAANGDVFDLEVGVAFRVDLRLDTFEPAIVARLGRAFELGYDADLVPYASVTLKGVGDQPGSVIKVNGTDPLPTVAWVTVELVHDGHWLALVVDGREQAGVAAAGAPFQRQGDQLEVSLGNSPVHGLVDEIRLLAYDRGARLALPDGVEWLGLQGPIRFGRRGELVAPKPARFTLQLDEEKVVREIGPGGVLR
ncbi:MAG: prepilin-type N-terminal cleavage/methylation domain-containing protein [Planctomycetota bacterium]